MTSEEERQALAELVQWIDTNVSGIEIQGDERSRISAACFDVAVEHQAAILVLSSSQLYGSMFSLLRILTEALVRGLWLAQCATEAELEKFKKHRIDKNFGELIADIERTIGYDKSPLSKFKENSWKFLNGFTHTGFYQVTRRNSEEFTGPNYPEEEIVKALAFSGALGLIAASQLAGMSNQPPLLAATMERMKEYVKRSAHIPIA